MKTITTKAFELYGLVNKKFWTGTVAECSRGPEGEGAEEMQIYAWSRRWAWAVGTSISSAQQRLQVARAQGTRRR